MTVARYPGPHLRYPNEASLLLGLRRVAASLGRPPTSSEYDQLRQPGEAHRRTIGARLGSWQASIARALWSHLWLEAFRRGLADALTAAREDS